MKKLLLALATLSVAIPTAPALADPPRRGHHYSAAYDGYGRYREPRRLHRGDNMWRGRDGRYYCRRSNGTTGLIIGAAGGAFLGRAVDTRGERATGTIVGAALGALIGRDLDRGDLRCR